MAIQVLFSTWMRSMNDYEQHVTTKYYEQKEIESWKWRNAVEHGHDVALKHALDVQKKLKQKKIWLIQPNCCK